MSTIQINCVQCGTVDPVPAEALLASVDIEDPDTQLAGAVSWICSGCHQLTNAQLDWHQFLLLITAVRCAPALCDSLLLPGCGRARVDNVSRPHRASPHRSRQEGDMTGTEDSASLRELSQDECYRLLATQQIGRLGVNAEHYPLIFPVNYALDDAAVVVRTNAGLKLTAADHANVTFEVDDIDPFRRSGWSIVIRGLAEEVTKDHRDELIARTTATGVQPWAPGDRGHWLRIIPHRVTGRLIVPGELPPAFEAHGYL